MSGLAKPRELNYGKLVEAQVLPLHVPKPAHGQRPAGLMLHAMLHLLLHGLPISIPPASWNVVGHLPLLPLLKVGLILTRKIVKHPLGSVSVAQVHQLVQDL